jgi:type II secretory pathway pseudopilin PulG
MAAARKHGGFTFLGLLLVVAILGVGLMAVGEMWHTAHKREQERSLLFVGDQFRRAIRAYYQHTPPTYRQQPYPTTLEALLKDPRYSTTQRYLRKVYSDPITGSAEWGLLKRADGGIYGVYSLSEEVPIKQANFRFDDRYFAGKTKYTEWQFTFIPSQESAKTVTIRK